LRNQIEALGDIKKGRRKLCRKQEGGLDVHGNTGKFLNMEA
jgi:hypothetical protein